MAPKGVTIAAAMKLGGSLPDVERTTTWGAPTLKVRGKMMACEAINKAVEPNTLVVCMPIAERDELIAADPETYDLKPHYKDYPCVLVRLSNIEPDALRDLMGWDGSLLARGLGARLLHGRRNEGTPDEVPSRSSYDVYFLNTRPISSDQISTALFWVS